MGVARSIKGVVGPSNEHCGIFVVKGRFRLVRWKLQHLPGVERIIRLEWSYLEEVGLLC